MELKPGDRCPTCGQMIRGNYHRSPEAAAASAENGKKYGGRPINPDSKRQQKLREKEEKRKE